VAPLLSGLILLTLCFGKNADLADIICGLPQRWEWGKSPNSWSILRLTEHDLRFTGPDIDCGFDAGWPASIPIGGGEVFIGMPQT
jgi:hypothetical protein